MSCSERIFEKFDAWEKRGRGWHVWPAPVDLEPPFKPFTGYFESRDCERDTGRKPTFLTKLVDGVREMLEPGCTKVEPSQRRLDDEPEPEFLEDETPLSFIRALLPGDFDSGKASTEQLLSSLSKFHETISFEIIGTADSVLLQFACPERLQNQLLRQLESHFPSGTFLIAEDRLASGWNDGGPETGFVFEFGLGQEFMIPFDVPTKFVPDPLISVIGAMSEVERGEIAALQILFKAAEKPWGESIMRSVTAHNGRAIFVNAPELPRQARNKLSSPLFSVVIRVAIQTGDEQRFRSLAQALAGALSAVSSPNGNELIPLHNEEYEWTAHENDFLARRSARSGMLLNREELSFFVHLPGSDVKSAKLVRDTKRSKATPTIVHGNTLLLGLNRHAGQETAVTLTPEQRTRHMHIIGASGTGKSTLLFNLIRQDIEQGGGVGVLDPHGDLIERLLEIIPEHRMADVVLVDPGDEEFSVGLNILSAHSDAEKNLLASDLVSVFERLSTSWGDQMGAVLRSAILAFLESNEGGTLADMRRFLLDPAFRSQFLTTVQDPEIVYYWQKAFPQLSGNKSLGPVLTRLESFLGPKAIRYMVAQKANRLDFGDIMDGSKIFLAKLSQGEIGRENSYLLGSLLVAKFQQLATSRQRINENARRHFWLYVDEFQNFITPSMTEILSGARKYRLGLILAHQELQQLERSREVASAVLSNCYTRIVFRVGDSDASKLAEGLSFFEPSDLQNLETGEAVARVERSSFDFNLNVPLSPRIPQSAA